LKVFLTSIFDPTRLAVEGGNGCVREKKEK